MKVTLRHDPEISSCTSVQIKPLNKDVKSHFSTIRETDYQVRKDSLS